MSAFDLLMVGFASAVGVFLILGLRAILVELAGIIWEDDDDESA